jgi:hypothetical protein
MFCLDGRTSAAELQVFLLQDSVMHLQLQKTAALRTGYNETFRSYQGLSDRYIAELKKPRFSLGSTLGLCIGAAGAGLLVGTVVNR